MSDEVIKNRKLAKKAARVKISEQFNNDLHFYYLRDKNRQIFGGACLKLVDGVWCRGISLWSTNDKFDRNESRRQARKRLMRAAFTKKDDLPVNASAHESAKKLMENYPSFFSDDFGFKVRYGANLTEAEKQTVSTERVNP